MRSRNGSVQHWRDILLHRLWLVSKTMTFSYTLRDIKNENERTCSKATREMRYIIVETLDADYEDIESLNNLDVINNTMRCKKHVKNCALQNVLKIYN